ncbi:ABC transporter substrate-binding protein [Lederbergia wuyishanensis]|uniref:ABC-type glycerol-3-phosphate transport system substrate-binding protein n=1 Tax=Lederbergia wuyishanensis TaxID=1347903 RepID=A0ABU0DA99_9BACI|nr:extracellular solute-binding protein [Lederbergia wuyishanensis]MCJ8009936.1 extracellular solute-binding protein [Lederbergia wuyishanensis]MDQ0345283.1 ABC-type glycerol-3-phosphate transport system substrate-binding protein [Lederbergia wuyishanensis]
MKKFYLSFLIMTIFVLFLAACSSGQQSSGTNNDQEKESEPKEEEVVQEEEPEETYDLGGRVIKIVDHYDRNPLIGTEFGDIRQELLEAAEKKYNVKIEYVVVPFDEKVNQLTTSILAGDPYADIIGLSATQAGPLIQQDFFYALDDIVDLSKSKMTQGMKDIGKVNEKAYMMKFQVNESGGMYYNKTMFEEAGLQDPYELQKNGEWTWEAMLDAAKKLTKDGVYGLSADPSIISEYSIFSNDAQFLDTNTGEIVLDSPNSIEALDFVVSLYNEHKVIKPNEGNDWEDPRRYFTEGLVGMTQGWIWEAYDRVEAPFEWGYVMWPKGPKASSNVVPLSDVSGDFIPKGVKDPEVVYKIWEDLQIWDGWEDDVVDWFESVLPSEEAIDTAVTMLDNIKPNYWKVYNLNDAFYETFSNIAHGEESPTQAIAKIKGEAQARVDEFLGKK